MAAAEYHTIDLARLSLGSGQAASLELRADPGPLEIGGTRYSLGSEASAGPGSGGRNEAIPVRLDVSRTATGYALRIRYAGVLEGPCMRCLEPARPEIAVDAREVDQPRTGDEELTSPYVTDGVLDLTRWAHDALVLSCPQQVLCRPDCAGLCAVCGGLLNDAEPGAHDHPRDPDPRWAKLRELG